MSCRRSHHRASCAAAVVVALAAPPMLAATGDPRRTEAAGGAAEEAERPVERVRVAASVALREVASPVARVLVRLEEAAELPVLDRSGSWVRVAAGGRTGWVDLAAVEAAGGEEGGGPAAAGGEGSAGAASGSGSAGAVGGRQDGSTRASPAPSSAPGGDVSETAVGGGAAAGGSAPELVPVTSDPAAALLAAARAALGSEVQELVWGRFSLLTDRPEHSLIAIGERVAAALPALHARRYGLEAGEVEARAGDGALLPPRLGTIVLFGRDADYRAVLATLAGDLVATDLAGHAGGGVAVLPLGGRTARQAAGTLIHEIAHLLNQRAFGPELPAWLDEGLAGDLELVEVGSGGELIESRWAEGSSGYRGRRTRTGPLVALDRLLGDAARGRLETLPDLMALDRTTLVASPRRAELYALAALWVRFLLDDPARAAGFRRFLPALATTAPPPADGGATLLAETLATDLPALERPFRRWLQDLARRH
jgi:hypothetical protein